MVPAAWTEQLTVPFPEAFRALHGEISKWLAKVKEALRKAIEAAHKAALEALLPPRVRKCALFHCENAPTQSNSGLSGGEHVTLGPREALPEGGTG